MKAIISLFASVFLVVVSVLALSGRAAHAQDGAHPQDGETGDVILVDAGRELAQVNPLLFGQNYGPWMNTTDSYLNLYKAANVTLLRFPGGNYGDENDTFPNNLDDLALLARQLKAQVVVQTRSWRSGTPEKAAELVRYANIEKKYHFVYWEVGNEPDLYKDRVNQKGDPVFDVDWYNTHFRAVTKAMKAVDPSIKVVGPATTSGWKEWIPPFLKANGDIVDVISWHYYAHGSELTDVQALDAAKNIEDQVKQIRRWWKDPQVNPLGYKRPVPPLLLSEYNISAASSVKHQLGTEIAALWNAELLGRMANQGVEMGAHFAMQGTSWQGLIGMLEDPRPVYAVYELYSRWGVTQVAASSPDNRLLPVFASRTRDGSLAVMVINKDPQQYRNMTVQMKHFRPDGIGKATAYLQDETHPVEVQAPLEMHGSTFDYRFPPYSVTLLVIPAAPFNPWTLVIGIVTVLFLAMGVFFFLKSRDTLRGRRGSSRRGSRHSGR